MGLLSAGSTIANAAIGMIGQRKREKRAMNNQKQLMDIQHKNQRELNQQGFDLQKRMWDETNYEAQMEHLKNAGLNPALMYGMSGGGGVTTGSQGGGSAASGHAPAPQDMPSMDIQQALMMNAQIKLMEAQAKKAEAEADSTRGIEGTKGAAEIANLTQGIENQKAVEALTRAQERLTKIEAYIADSSKEDRIDSIIYNAEKAMHDANIAAAQSDVDSSTIKEKKNIIAQMAVGAALDNVLKRENITKTKEEIREISQGILQKWEALKQSGQNVDINKFNAEIKADYPTIGTVMGKMGNAWLDLLESIATGVIPNRKVD